MGIRQAVLAVNKMDLVGYDRRAFSAAVDAYQPFARGLGIDRVTAVPMSALTGENVFVSGGGMPWYDGPTLMEILESAAPGASAGTGAFRLPVQWVSRPNSRVPRLQRNRVVRQGRARDAGDRQPAGPKVDGGAHLRAVGRPRTGKGESVDHADAGRRRRREPRAHDRRGSIGLPRSPISSPPHLIWMDASPMLPKRSYLARFASASAVARITDLTHRSTSTTSVGWRQRRSS